MSYQLHEKLQQLKPYKVIAEDCEIRLDANESFIDPGDELKTKLLNAWGNISLNRYPDDNYKQLRQAFGNYYSMDPELVVPANGSDELLSMLIGCFLKSDEKLLLAQPDFSMYEIFATNYEKKLCTVPRTESGLIHVPETLDQIRKQDARALLFSNPSSATSTVTLKRDVMELVDNTDALVIVDEAYMDFSDQSVLHEAASRDNLIVLRTCSKALGCAGIRLGFAVSSPGLIHVINALRAPYNLNTLSESAGCIILSQKEYIEDAVARILENRRQLFEGLKALEASPVIKTIYPTATNYICVKTDHANEIYEALKARSILVRNLKTMLRITVGTKEENMTFLNEMRAIVNEIEEVVRCKEKVR